MTTPAPNVATDAGGVPARADVAIVGGGVTGSTLACVLARAGVDVVVLEKQSEYRDRAQGEALMPWGGAEARAMEVLDDVVRAGAVLREVHQFDRDLDVDRGPVEVEDVTRLFPGVPGIVGVGHPVLTATMEAGAVEAGATIRFGADVCAVEPGRVRWRDDDGDHELAAGLVVGADGKGSRVRDLLGKDLHEAGPRASCVGMLAAGLGDEVPQDVVSIGLDDVRSSVVFPQGDGRARLYHMFADDPDHPYRGSERGRRFLDDFATSPIPWGAGVAAGEPAGPCARFPIFDAWVDDPRAPGVVLVGDAAGFSNPVCAQGIAIGMRDVRLVSEAVLGSAPADGSTTDRFAAYADDRARRMARLRTVAQFFSLTNLPGGPGHRELRRRVRDVVARDPDAAVAFTPIHQGPAAPPDHVFDPGWLEATFGVRLGEQPWLLDEVPAAHR